MHVVALSAMSTKVAHVALTRNGTVLTAELRTSKPGGGEEEEEGLESAAQLINDACQQLMVDAHAFFSKPPDDHLGLHAVDAFAKGLIEDVKTLEEDEHRRCEHEWKTLRRQQEVRWQTVSEFRGKVLAHIANAAALLYSPTPPVAAEPVKADETARPRLSIWERHCIPLEPPNKVDDNILSLAT